MCHNNNSNTKNDTDNNNNRHIHTCSYTHVFSVRGFECAARRYCYAARHESRTRAAARRGTLRAAHQHRNDSGPTTPGLHNKFPA